MSESTKQHECIHWLQQKELLFIGHWILYLAFWLYYMVKLKNGKDAYRASPFEMEAYRNEHVIGYLKNRKRFEWLRYLK
ncbi:MAG: hypothetical protein HOJ16_00180 [Candidatus Peribacter sp.]|nr:hypothetical protein [Candidatus Peribacter sp.]